MVDVSQLKVGCHALIPYFNPGYGYVPSLAAGITFCALFGASMIAHTAQFCWKRTWWCCVFTLGCITELIGWGGRTWSSQCPYNATAFLMQISTLIIAPVFFTAGVYILLGRFIQILGRETSILSPSLYLWIFCTCDIISLIIQAIGGGMASAAANKVNGNTAPGTNTMVAGIVFQLFSISVFVGCAADFLRRTRTLRHQKTVLQPLSTSIMPLLFAMVVSVLCIYIRSIYRTIELLQGWQGYLITHQTYFVALDGAMMVVAVGVFNFIHPGWFLPGDVEKVDAVHREPASADAPEMNTVQP